MAQAAPLPDQVELSPVEAEEAQEAEPAASCRGASPRPGTQRLLPAPAADEGKSQRQEPGPPAKSDAMAKAADAPASSAVWIKWSVLVFLVVQNSAGSLLMRYSRSMPGEQDWNPQSGVIMQEVIKGLTCIILLQCEGGVSSIFTDPVEFLKTGIPAFLYLLQNNLQYIALSYLNAPTYAVLYQMKILSTGVLSVFLLGKSLSMVQWLALVLLTAGVAMVTLSQLSPSQAAQALSGDEAPLMAIVPGIVAVLCASVFSGLAGVSFEKMLKGSQVSLWARNLQLAFYSVALGLLGLVMQQRGDSGEIAERGFFHGYTAITWLAIANNALGGLLIAVVIKYADNIMKNFSQGMSLILTAHLSCVIFKSSISGLFAVGVAAVIYSVALYGGAIQPVPPVVRKLFN